MPPMKISGVDRCGCLIQSARLESSDLRYPSTLSPLSTSLSIRFQLAITIGCDSSSGESNPFGESTDSLFVPAPLSLSFSLSFPLFRFLYPSSLSWSARGLMTVLPSRESLPGERFATEGCSYRFPGAFRPFYPPRFSPRSFNVSF